MTAGYQGSAGHHFTRIVNLAYFYPVLNPSVGQIFNFTPDTNYSVSTRSPRSLNIASTMESRRTSYTPTASLSTRFRRKAPVSLPTRPTQLTTAPSVALRTTMPPTISGRMRFGTCRFIEAADDLMGRLLGGWELNGIYQFHSGFPWTPVASNLCPVIGASGLCPLRPTAYNGGAGNDHETSAFLPPTSSNFPALREPSCCQPFSPCRPPAPLRTRGNRT